MKDRHPLQPKIEPVTVYLVRHGSAGLRNDDDPDDLQRNLDARGQEQARNISERLGDTPITAVISSPAPRCVQTVVPLAMAHGLEVDTHLALVEGNHIDAAWDLLEQVAGSGGNTVLCSHGDIIPELIDKARRRGMTVPAKYGCSKGSVWSLHWDGERFTQGEYSPTPPRH